MNLKTGYAIFFVIIFISCNKSEFDRLDSHTLKKQNEDLKSIIVEDKNTTYEKEIKKQSSDEEIAKNDLPIDERTETEISDLEPITEEDEIISESIVGLGQIGCHWPLSNENNSIALKNILTENIDCKFNSSSSFEKSNSGETLVLDINKMNTKKDNFELPIEIECKNENGSIKTYKGFYLVPTNMSEPEIRKSCLKNK